MSTDAGWLDGADADLESDLRAVGITIDGEDRAQLPAAQDGLDAAASQMLRLIAADDAELDRLSNACDAEIKLIERRYREIARPVAKRRDQKSKIIESIALHAGFESAKKKSRATPFGVYGIRHQPEKLQVLDPAQLLAWAKANAPEIVTWTTPRPVECVLHKEAERFFKPVDRETAEARAKLMEIAGVAVVPEHDKPYFRLSSLNTEQSE